MAPIRGEAYCTLLMSDGYLPGAMVLAHSLKGSGTKKQLAALVTLDSISSSTITELKTMYDHIIPVDRIVNRSPANLYLMDRPDLASAFTKIALWRQTQFTHLVYLDADVVALRAPDELFNLPQSFAAVPDIGWPDCFNSGVLSLKPNMGDYYALLALAQRGISFDGADQGLLNMHFRDWETLSFTYNCTPSGNYQYVPAYRHFASSISLVHFIGKEKPWIVGRGQMTAAGGVYEELLGRWWAVYDKHYRSPSKTQSRTVQQYVVGESTDADYGTFAAEPEASINTTEPSLTDQTDPAESLTKGEMKPTSTVQQRKFSVDWDPRNQPPPTNSKPEAPNFPHDTYQMSADRNLFQAPKPPEPPKGMYQIPATQPTGQRPKPIFPWEERAPKPTRVFAEDAPSETTPSITTDSGSEATETETETITPTTPSISFTSPEPFASYTRSNAWDDMPEIDRYISSLPQNRRARVQVLFDKGDRQGAAAAAAGHDTSSSTNDPSIMSPTSENPPSSNRRLSSNLITDFPTEIERPSLPVTPAPVRRPQFWSSHRDEAGDLPAAEGVPEQSQWDPVSKLVELARRQSEVLEKGPIGTGQERNIPARKFVDSSSTTAPVTIAERGEGEMGKEAAVAAEVADTAAAVEGGPMVTEAAVAAEVADTAAAVEGGPMVTEAAVAAEVADTAAAMERNGDVSPAPLPTLEGNGDGAPAPLPTLDLDPGTLNFAGGGRPPVGEDGGGRGNGAPPTES